MYVKNLIGHFDISIAFFSAIMLPVAVAGEVKKCIDEQTPHRRNNVRYRLFFIMFAVLTHTRKL